MFTRTHHWFLSCFTPLQLTLPHPICLRSISVLSSHLHLGLTRDLFPSGFATYISLPVHSCCMALPSRPWLYCSNCAWEEYQIWSSSYCSFVGIVHSWTQAMEFSFLPFFPFSQNVLFGTLFSNIQSLCCFPYCQETKFRPIQNHSKIIVLFIPVFTFLDSRWEV
jgi:hypothetical protein